MSSHGAESLRPDVPSAPARATIDLAGPSAQSQPGGKFEVFEKVGGGGCGVVYRAWDRTLNRVVALKMANDRGAALLTQDARLAAQLNHPNIITVYEFGTQDSVEFIAMEFVDGPSLKELLASGKALPWQRGVSMMQEIAAGLMHAHARGIVHRDIKPANILLPARGPIKLVDFGLAVDLAHAPATFAGTPEYASPEQARSRPVDQRADIFSLGATFYHALTGLSPFRADGWTESLTRVVEYHPPPPSSVVKGVPGKLDEIVLRCLAKDPAERYSDLSPAIADLKKLLDSPAARVQEEAVSSLASVFAEHEVIAVVAASDAFAAALVRAVSAVNEDGNSAPAADWATAAQNYELDHGRHKLVQIVQGILEEQQKPPANRDSAGAGSAGAGSAGAARLLADLSVSLYLSLDASATLATCLQQAGKKVRRLSLEEYPAQVPVNEVLVVELCGAADRPNRLVLTPEDRWELTRSLAAMPEGLRARLARGRLLLVNCGLEREELRPLFLELLRLACPDDQPSYALEEALETRTRRFWSRKGVQVTLGPVHETVAGLAEEVRRRDSSSSSPASRRPLPARPYKFLDYYEPDDAIIFFGREGETRALMEKLVSHRHVLLYARSGAGKSSILNAGVVPALRREGYRAVSARILDEPRLAIKQAVGHAFQMNEHDVQTLPLPTFLHKARAVGGRFVILVDQFEEMFVRYGPETRKAFIRELARVLHDPGSDVRVVIALREDFLAEMAEVKEFIPGVFNNSHRLADLTREQLREVIVSPAELLGYRYDEELIEKLLLDLGVEHAGLPQMQIVCDRLFDARDQGQQVMGLRIYQRLGGARGILANYLDGVLKRLPADEQRLSRQLLKGMITSLGTKTVIGLEELSRGVREKAERVEQALHSLEQARIVRRIEREGTRVYELAHECLVPEISSWLDTNEQQLLKVKELLRQGLDNFQRFQMVLSAEQLAIVRGSLTLLDLSAEEKELLKKSQKTLTTRRRRRIVYVAAALVAAVALGLAGMYWYLQAGTFAGTETKRLSIGDRVVDDVRISVMQGRPGLPLFGFPRPIHRTIINSTEIDLPLLDKLSRGITISSREQWQRELPHLLRPYHRGKFLHFMGAPVEEVVPHLTAGLDSDNPVERLRSLWLLARLGKLPRNWSDKLDEIHHPFDFNVSTWKMRALEMMDLAESRDYLLREARRTQLVFGGGGELTHLTILAAARGEALFERILVDFKALKDSEQMNLAHQIGQLQATHRIDLMEQMLSSFRGNRSWAVWQSLNAPHAAHALLEAKIADRDVGRNAARALTSLGRKSDLKPFLHFLSDGAEAERESVIRTLGYHNRTDHRDKIWQIARSEERELREAAIDALCYMGEKPDWELVQKVRTTSTLLEQQSVLAWLRYHPEERAALPIAEALQSAGGKTEPWQLSPAMGLLAELPGYQADEELRRLLDHKDAAIWSAAALVVDNRARPEAFVPRLRELWKRGDDERIKVALALSIRLLPQVRDAISLDDILAVLEKCRSDPRDSVRNAAQTRQGSLFDRMNDEQVMGYLLGPDPDLRQRAVQTYVERLVWATRPGELPRNLAELHVGPGWAWTAAEIALEYEEQMQHRRRFDRLLKHGREMSDKGNPYAAACYLRLAANTLASGLMNPWMMGPFGPSGATLGAPKLRLGAQIQRDLARIYLTTGHWAQAFQEIDAGVQGGSPVGWGTVADFSPANYKAYLEDPAFAKVQAEPPFVLLQRRYGWRYEAHLREVQAK